MLFDLIDSDFNGGSEKKINKNAFWSNNPKIKSFFTKTSLKRTTKVLIEILYFIVGNALLLQIVVILKQIDPAPFVEK